MGCFKDEDDVYAFIGRLFQELAIDPELAPKFKKADTTVQYRMRDPESQITVDMRPDREMRVDLGPTDLDPEVVMTTDADTAHRFWLGKVNVTAALARGQITAKGPVAKVLRLVPLVKPTFPRYEQMLRDAGRTDLLEAA
jgi:SCP-2 sterol transfer family